MGNSQLFNIGPSGFVECDIETREGFCELSLTHDDWEYPNTMDMELTREQATEIAKILAQWAEKEGGEHGQEKG